MGISRMNKKGLEFKRGFQAMLAFSVIIIALGVILTNWSGKYGVTDTSDLGEFNKIDDLSDDITSQSGQLTPNDPDPGQDAEANTFRGVYGVIGNILNSFNVITGDDGLIESLSDRFGIPLYVGQFIVGLILIAVIFSLIGIIFRLGRPG